MEVKHDINSIPITSSEIAYLWNTYLLNSKSKHVLMYAVAQCIDEDMRSILQMALDSSAKAMTDVKEIFEREKQRVPYGFSEEDVYIDSPKIYSDKLMLQILKVYAMIGLSNYGTAISLSPRQDTRKFFNDNLKSTIALSNKIDDLLLEKGMYIRTPAIPATQENEFANDNSIMGRIIGHKRPLTAIEIAGLFNCSLVISISEAQLLGMAQTIKDGRLKEFLDRSRKALKEHYDIINDILHREDLCFPPSLESEVSSSQEPVFSDRLSIFFCYATLADILATLSMAMVGVMRKDVTLNLTQVKSEIMLLAKDGTDLMLERKWYEEMPKNVNRNDML